MQNHVNSYTYTQNYIYIHMLIPFADNEIVYDLYQANVFPISLYSDDPYNTGCTVISNVADLFAIDRSKSKYIELSQSQLYACHHDKLILCPGVFPSVERSFPSCTSSLFFDKTHTITNMCSMKIVPNTSVPPQIIELSPGTYLVSSPKTKFSIVCPDTSVTYLEQCNLCQIHVKCRCTLNVSHLKVTAPLDICHLTLPAIKIKHGINMALMNHFHLNSPQLTHGSSLSTHPIKLQIPNISQNIQKFKDLTDDQKHTALDLHKVIEAIKEERDTYNTINLTATETFLSKLPFSDNDAFFTMWQYMSMFLITGLIISHFILVFRVRKLSALAIFSSVVPTAESAEILTPTPSYIYITPSTTVDPFQSYYYLIAMLTVIGTIFAFIRFAHFIGNIMSHFPRTMQRFRLCSGPRQKLYTSRGN